MPADSGYEVLNPGPAALSLPPFRARFPWIGPDLQTLSSRLRPGAFSLNGSRNEHLRFEMPDSTGDTLLGELSWPDDAAAAMAKPVIVMLHGLTGCARSRYMLESASFFNALGYPVMRLNLRGAGPTMGLCAEQYHSGRSEDLRAVLAGLPASLQGRDLLLFGFSLGANLILKYLGEGAPAAPIRAAIAVSPPIDLKQAQKRISSRRNRAYEYFLMAGMRREALSARNTVAAVGRGEIAAAADIYDFDNRVTAPVQGFADADAYYHYASSSRYLSGVGVPSLIVHALDDPWIPARMFHDHDWQGSKAISVILTRSGGHVGFVSNTTQSAWYLHCAQQFIETIARESR